jgi:hypothetical protein
MVALFVGLVAVSLASLPRNNTLLLDNSNRAFILRHGHDKVLYSRPVLGRAVIDSLGLHLEDVFISDDDGRGLSSDPADYPAGRLLLDESPPGRHVLADIPLPVASTHLLHFRYRHCFAMGTKSTIMFWAWFLPSTQVCIPSTGIPSTRVAMPRSCMLSQHHIHILPLGISNHIAKQLALKH